MINEKFSKAHLVSGLVLLALLLGAVLFILFSDDKETVTKTKLKPIPQTESTYPAQKLDLSKWKLTLPVMTPGNPSEPLNILQPQLATYQMNPWFTLAKDKTGAIFRAPVNAPTTKNSDYPRSELREMTDGGTKEAFWPSKTGTHTLFLDQAITAVPKNKPEVVAGQIHGDDDDLITIRLDYPKLYVARSKSNLATLDENYTLGKRFNVKFVANNGKIMVYYNNGTAPVYTLEKKVDQAYFKAGVYTQSNCKSEELPELCNSNNYGEVIINKAEVSHK